MPEFLAFFLFLGALRLEGFEIEEEGCGEPFWNEKGKSLTGVGEEMLGSFGERRGFGLGAVRGGQ